ncbi:hypothetical protein [Blastochloris viridis]|uniref:Uncharacterized protein n=1 Tax=Blastochloris viridis TaxID=1079 RepID=A0A0H5BQA3_BLAVI|nr:hypothetical protein [Blastochloris viridis]ALK09516.1 hypothetical protein BVIR_1741 [Blastochloris viridis]BAS00599.1 hypothetical protein BV133_3005 [Blastochloris viridis]CUU42179.1 hypothetical protein BVIRIDIS_11860 [Blastochloris viridis]
MIEPLLPVALFCCAVSVLAGFALGRATLPEPRGVYAYQWPRPH